MNEFIFYAPTKVIFGKQSEESVGELLKKENAHKVFVHYGGSSAMKSGLLDRVYTSLEKAGIDYVSLGGVIANPVLSKVKEGVALCKREHVDYLLAVGGGSVIDSTKGIAYGMVNDGELWDYYSKKRTVTGCMPLGCIVTIAAAGSEMSDSSVITNEEGNKKRGLSSDYGRCRFAIMNPELTYTLPSYQTASGCSDIILHTMERYFVKENNMELTDGFAQSLMRTVMKYALLLKQDPKNYEARANIMWAGSLSHNDVTGIRVSGDWAAHQLEHELSGMFGVAHGAGLCAVWASWARYVYQEKPERFAQYAHTVMDIKDSGNVEQDALAGIKATEDFFAAIDMPITIHELGITIDDEVIDTLAYKCSYENTRTIGKFKILDTEDMKQIYQMAR